MFRAGMQGLLWRRKTIARLKLEGGK